MSKKFTLENEKTLTKNFVRFLKDNPDLDYQRLKKYASELLEDPKRTSVLNEQANDGDHYKDIFEQLYNEIVLFFDFLDFWKYLERICNTIMKSENISSLKLKLN